LHYTSTSYVYNIYLELETALQVRVPGGHVKTLKLREQREQCHAGTTYIGLAGVRSLIVLQWIYYIIFDSHTKF